MEVILLLRGVIAKGKGVSTTQEGVVTKKEGVTHVRGLIEFQWSKCCRR